MDTERQRIDRETEAWNVAKGYTQLKILRPLVEMDKLVKIAIYGAEQVEDCVLINQDPKLKIQMRVEAMRRLIDSLLEVFENAHFACSKDTEKLEELEKQVHDVEDVMDAIMIDKIDQRDKTERKEINEPHFLTCLTALRKIKKEVPVYLNNNDLIFPSSDEIDLAKIKDEIVHGG